MENFLYHYSYVAVFVLCFVSSMGLPVGAELAVIGGGALASGEVHKLASNGATLPEVFHLSLAAVIVVAVAGELLGSSAGYLIGYYGGRPLVDRFGKFVLLTHKDLDRAEAWFDRHGEPLVLFGRFIPLLRSFVSFAAGLAEMALVKFVIFTVIGCAVWCTALTLLGDSLGSSYNQVQKSFSDAGYVILALAVVAVALLFWHRLRTMREERL
ncbi:MAG: DedA family protein [Acidimicrobiales bacterium]|jgi:membrane protein DedA with SNARE-associated domain